MLTKCPECGHDVSTTADKCPNCGYVLRQTDIQEALQPGARNKTTAGLLALLLGSVGAQFFYMGAAGAGILCVLFCWTGIPSVVAIFQGITYLCMSDAEFNAKYNTLANTNPNA